MAHLMLQEKRATRGKRMSALVGKAAEEDDAFYNNEIWQEGDDSENDSYSEESEKPDVFDSDFNESEDSDDEEEDESVDEEREVPAKKSKYKDPTERKKQKKTQEKSSIDELADDTAMEVDGETSTEVKEATTKKPIQKVGSTDSVPYEPRKVRESTKAKTAENLEKQRFEQETKLQTKRKPKSKVVFDQMELLKEALETEELSYRWLQRKKFMTKNAEAAQAELLESQKPKRKPLKDFVRWYSSKTAGNYLTFSSYEVYPDLLKKTIESPEPPPKNCVITGLPAKYRDPKSMLPYANLEAYKEIQRRLADGTLQPWKGNNKNTTAKKSSVLIPPSSSQPQRNRNSSSSSPPGKVRTGMKSKSFSRSSDSMRIQSSLSTDDNDYEEVMMDVDDGDSNGNHHVVQSQSSDYYRNSESDVVYVDD